MTGNAASHETGRKSIHVAAGVAAAAVAFSLPGSTARAVFLAVALLALAVELARRLHPLGAAFQRVFGRWLRPGEVDGLTGATTLAIGFAAAVLIFPQGPAVIGILYAGLADTAAAVVGTRWGRRSLPGGKSVAGSAAFLATAASIGLATPFLGPGPAILAAVLATAVESLSGGFDDNLLLPPAGAAAAWLASFVLL